MKTKFCLLFASLLLSLQSFAGDLVNARTVVVHPSAQFNFFSDEVPTPPLTMFGFGTLSIGNFASCDLDLNLDTFQGIAKFGGAEAIQDGQRYSVEMVQDYPLAVISRSTVTGPITGGTCDTGPDLCSHAEYIQTQIVLGLIDSRGNQSTLTCVTDLTRPPKMPVVLQTSDLNIVGVEAKN